MRAHHSSRALAIDAQVAHVELLLGRLNLVVRVGIDRARQAELGVVGDINPPRSFAT